MSVADKIAALSTAVLFGMVVSIFSVTAAQLDVVDQNQTGTQYSPLAIVNRENVSQLELAWTYHNGDLAPDAPGLYALEDQPSLIEGNLIVCSISRKISALDPATGKERWVYDPKSEPARMRKCRGVANWVDTGAEPGTLCQSRIFIGTADYSLHAIDAKTGALCPGFGNGGVVDMPVSKEEIWPGEVIAGSNPAVVNDVVVVGSSVADLQRVNPPSGRVLAFSARSGAMLWQFDPVPRDKSDPAMATWEKGTEGFGQGNVWSSMAVDQSLDLVYLPTTSASDDYYGGHRPGDNLYTSSVVALRGTTGEVVWHQQLVHHNVWDYDVPARPMLIEYLVDGEPVPALVQNTKMGLVFVFNRATGEPLVPLVEKPVPQTGAIPGEVLSPTQPFPEGMPALVAQSFSPEDVWGFTYFDKRACRKKVEAYDYGPIYTPITERGTVLMPAVGGGANWGGGGYDPGSHIMVVPTNRVPTIVKLTPRAKSEATSDTAEIESSTAMTFTNPGADFVVSVEPLLSNFGAPCSEPPWAALTAVDIVQKKIVWDVPLGSIKKLAPIPIDWHLGTPSAGGPLVTAGGLVFIGYSSDDMFRAFDLSTGEIVWEAELPAAATSVPITYEVDGEQYIVVPAGGHSMFMTTLGDSVVAFKLPAKK